MGFIRVPVKVFAPADGHQPVEVEALVDTGANYSILPRQALESLGVTPLGRGRFRTIEGRPIERDVANVAIEVAGRRSLGMVPVIFGEPNDRPVLGVTALEMMGLAVDPARGELRPTEFLML
ncbi:MAG: aspartyl protease family protein [Dehalococcoidia bacterium]